MKAAAKLEEKTGKSFSGEDPHLLLVSVRSGAKFSMPGMMDTILNLGLNDQRTQLLAKETNLDFAYNCYRRLLQMFADVVYGIDKGLFDDQLAAFEQKQNKKVHDFDLAQQQELIQHYKDLYTSKNFLRTLMNNSSLPSKLSSNPGTTIGLEFIGSFIRSLMI